MKSKKFLFFLLVGIILGIQIWFGYLRVQYPYLGIFVTLNEEQQWVVSHLDNGRQSFTLDVQPGDVITSINGEDPNEHRTVTRWRVIEQADTFEATRGNEHLVFYTEVLPNSLRQDILPIVAGIICFFSAILLYARVRASTSAYMLSLLFLTIGVTFMSLAASVRGDLAGKVFMLTSLTLVPVFFLHFLIVFFREKNNLQLKSGYLPYLYGIVAVHALLIGLTYFQAHVPYTLYKLTKLTVSVLFVVGITWNLTLLTRLFIKYRKQQSYLATIIRTVYFSLLISFMPVVVFSFAPKFIMKQELISSFYTSWFILLFPIAFAYLIITKKLYDIDTVLRRVLLTVVMAIIPSIIITLTSALFYYPNFEWIRLLYSFIVILIVFTFVLYSLEHTYTRLERVMFPRKHMLQEALKKISKNLTSTSSFRDLKDLILVDIVSTLQVYGGAIVFKYKESAEVISEGNIDVSIVHQLVDRQVEEHPDYTCLEVNRHEEHTSFLVISDKKSNTKLSLEEVQWLNLIVSYLAVSLENVYLIRKLTSRLQQLAAQMPDEKDAADLNWFRKMTFELQEQERMRIASDLHDTTMQDLFFLKRKLAMIRDKPGLAPDTVETVRSLIEYVEIINVNLRQSCFDLHPYLLQEIGLIRTLNKIIERETYNCPFEIQFDASTAHAIERRDLETKRHLFRIVQELLNNARKHSEATVVKIRLAAHSGQFHLYYDDDGVGYDPTTQHRPDIRTSGVGMEQMRSRIIHLHGDIEFVPSEQSGVHLHISFPAKEGLTA